MPWNKSGDSGGTHPKIMRIFGMRGADSRSPNEVAGFYWRLTNQASQHLVDFVVDAGTVHMFSGGGKEGEALIALAIRAGFLTKVKVDGLVAYELLNDPELVHIRTRAEIERERQQKADTANKLLSVPVRLRDGDQCRYCGVVCVWSGRTSNRRGTLDHLYPGEAATVATMVVACLHCNSSLRDMPFEERIDLLKPVPSVPFYSKSTAKWLAAEGHRVQPTEAAIVPDEEPERPRSQRDNAPSDPAASGTTQPTASAPAPAGHRAAGTPNTPATPRGNDPPKPDANRISQPREMHSMGSGRDGSGRALGSSPDQPSARRRRSRRGRGTSPHGDPHA